MGVRHWLEPDILNVVDKTLKDELLRERSNFQGMRIPFGPYTIESLRCEIDGYDVQLRRYSGRSQEFVGSRFAEPAYIERVIDGSMCFGISRAPFQGRRHHLHEAVVSAGTGAVIQVRRGSHVTFRLSDAEAFSLMVIHKPPRFDLPPLPAIRFEEILSRLQNHYWGIDPNDFV